MMIIELQASTSSTGPQWVTVFGSVSSIITAVGVIVAGAFTYFKFIKGRTFRPKCSIDIRPQLVTVGGAPEVRVLTAVRNEGHIALLFPPAFPQQLLLGQADSAICERSCKHSQPIRWEDCKVPVIKWPLAVPDGIALDHSRERRRPRPWWQRPTRHSMLGLLVGERLEPGEQWLRSVLIPLSPNILAYLLRVEVNACRHVAARHIIWHHLFCCRTGSARLNWSNEIYVLPEESNTNGHGPKRRIARRQLSEPGGPLS